MSDRFEHVWAGVIDSLDERPEAVAALARVLSRRGALDGLLAEASEELRQDRGADTPAGRLGEALALIEAGAAKDAVLAAGISERTYFRARATAKTANAHRARWHASLDGR